MFFISRPKPDYIDGRDKSQNWFRFGKKLEKIGSDISEAKKMFILHSLC